LGLNYEKNNIEETKTRKSSECDKNLNKKSGTPKFIEILSVLSAQQVIVLMVFVV